MLAKLIQRKEATELRKRGYSVNEIHNTLGVSKGSVSLWVRDVPLSDRAKARILLKRREGIEKSRQVKFAQTSAKLKGATEFALEALRKIPNDKNHARLYCALLYWCEGEKSKNDTSLIFTNSDPLLVTAFLRSLRQGYEIKEEKFRVCIHLHGYHDTKTQLSMWSKVTGISTDQFIKPYLKPTSGRYQKIGYEGCASVRYHDVKIARQVQAVARAFLNR